MAQVVKYNGLNEPPPVFPDLMEVVDCQVGRPPGPEWGPTGTRE